MGSFLLLLFIIFIVIPLGRLLWTVFKVRSNYKKAVNNARQAQASYQAQNRPGGWSAPRRERAKKVSPNVGEYVEWEDVEVTSSTTAQETSKSSPGKTTRYFEERISDVEWEEIKTKKP